MESPKSRPLEIAAILLIVAIFVGAACFILRSPAPTRIPIPTPPDATYTFPQQYSAETRSGVTIRGMEELNNQDITGRIYKDGDKVRTEIDGLPDGTGIFISRADLGKVYQLHADTKTVTWKPLLPGIADSGVTGPHIQFQALFPFDDHGVANEMYFYRQGDKNTQLAVRLKDHAPLYLVTADANGKSAISIHYDHYHAGPPPAALFELPPDYRIISSQ